MKIRKLISVLFLVPLLLALVSCWDLGDYENEVDYTNAFEVYTIDSNNNKTQYEMSQFYNKEIKDFKLPENFEANEYKYLALKVTKESIKVGQIFFYVKGEQQKRLTCKVSVGDIPKNFIDLDKERTNLKKYIDDHAADPSSLTDYEQSSNGEPKNCLTSSHVDLKTNKFDAIGFAKYEGKDTITVYKDQYIIFEFYNNTDTGIQITKDTTLEELDAQIAARRENRVKISFTAILIYSSKK